MPQILGIGWAKRTCCSISENNFSRSASLVDYLCGIFVAYFIISGPILERHIRDSNRGLHPLTIYSSNAKLQVVARDLYNKPVQVFALVYREQHWSTRIITSTRICPKNHIPLAKTL